MSDSLKIRFRYFLYSLLILFNSSVYSADEKITAYELHTRLLSFTNTYLESIAEVVDNIMRDDIEPRARFGYQGVKVIYVSAAINIATEPESIRQLMDMMVMIRLQKTVWGNGGFPYSKEHHVNAIFNQLQKLENDIIKLASLVFTPEDIRNIMSLVDDWKRLNANRHYIAFVRFQNFPDSDIKHKLEQSIKSGGLFSSINEAKLEIEEARQAAERAIFLANHMPIILEWQAELFLYRTLATKEIQTLIESGDDFTAATVKLADVIEALPKEAGGEAQKLFELNHKSINQITSDLVKASDNFKSMSDNLSPLFLQSDSNDDGETDLQQIQNVFTNLREASIELAALSDKLIQFNYDEDSVTHLSELLTTQRNAFNEMVTQQQNRMGTIIAGLIVLFFICMTISMLIIRRKT